jgi:hypothetical protein
MANAVTLWHLPPFFTIQPVQATLDRQLRLWSDVLFLHTTANALHAAASTQNSASPVSVTGAGGALGSSHIVTFCQCYNRRSSIFNAGSGRRLPPEGIDIVLRYMVETFPDRCIRTDAYFWRRQEQQPQSSQQQPSATKSSRTAVPFGKKESPATGPSNPSFDTVESDIEILVFASPTVDAVMNATVVQWLDDQGQLLTDTGSVCTVEEIIEEGPLTPGQGYIERIPLTELRDQDAEDAERLLTALQPAGKRAIGGGSSSAAPTTTQPGQPPAIAVTGVEASIVLRSLLTLYCSNGGGRSILSYGSSTRYIQIALFNMDGSESWPFQGVKFTAN